MFEIGIKTYLEFQHFSCTYPILLKFINNHNKYVLYTLKQFIHLFALLTFKKLIKTHIFKQHIVFLKLSCRHKYGITLKCNDAGISNLMSKILSVAKLSCAWNHRIYMISLYLSFSLLENRSSCTNFSGWEQYQKW